MHEIWSGFLTYTAAGFALLFAHSSDLLTLGGAILLGARLVTEVPRAYKALMLLRKPRK